MVKTAKRIGDPDQQDWRAILTHATHKASQLTASAHVRPAHLVEQKIRHQVTNAHLPGNAPIRTGIAALDSYLNGGMRGGNFIAIGAPTKAGKTVVAASISHNLEVDGINHLFVSLERSETEIDRLKIARRLGIKGFALHNIGPDDYDCLPPLERTCNYLHTPSLTIDDIRAEILYQVHVNNCRVAIIDYWQLIGGRHPREKPEDHLTRVAQLLQQTCVDANIPLIVTVQMTEFNVPKTSTSIKDACNVFLVLQRDRGSADAYFETHVSNIGPETNLGTIGNYSLYLDNIGPHFRDPPPRGQNIAPRRATGAQ